MGAPKFTFDTEFHGAADRPSPAARATGPQAVRGQGVSIMLRDQGYWACAAQIAVTPETGEVKVEKVTIVMDLGIVVNPLQLRRQVQAGGEAVAGELLPEGGVGDEGGGDAFELGRGGLPAGEELAGGGLDLGGGVEGAFAGAAQGLHERSGGGRGVDPGL